MSTWSSKKEHDSDAASFKLKWNGHEEAFNKQFKIITIVYQKSFGVDENDDSQVEKAT